MKKFDDFVELISSQINYGGRKYALDNKRESTDVLCDKHGCNWLFGTIDKYSFRFSNLKRERDLLKIAAYSYIIWLKRGFFLQEKGINDSIDTNLTIKNREFKNFISKTWNYYSTFKVDLVNVKDKLKLVSKILGEWSKKEWIDVLQPHIMEIFCLTFIEWYTYYSKIKEHDQDTFVEGDKNEKNY